MNKIIIDSRLIKFHLAYCKTHILPDIKSIVIKTEPQELKKYLEFCIERYDDIITGTVDKLRKIQEDMETHLNLNSSLLIKKVKKNKKNISLVDTFGYPKFSGQDTSYYSVEYMYSLFSNNKGLDEGLLNNNKNFKWTPYILAFLSKQRVCPYCGRQYITPVINESPRSKYKSRMRADFDHFWAKQKYPHFSMSIYNLILCCRGCNSSLKGSKALPFETPSPYEESYGDEFHFKIRLKNSNVDTTNIGIVVDDSRIEPVLDMFSIEKMYQYHNNIAKEFINKRLCYTDALIDCLVNELCSKKFFLNQDEIKEMILGFSINKRDIGNEVLGKLKYDLAKDVGFIK